MWLAIATGSLGCGIIGEPPPPVGRAVLPVLPGQSTGAFTTARPTVAAAVNDFFGRRAEPRQPLEFPHNIHIAQDIDCATCHEGVATGPRAGIPGLRTCMICHTAIATDRPRIQQIARMQEDGLDLAWQRVFGYTATAHVRFNHAPHIRAEVACATCHGDIAGQTVAQRNVELTMGACVNCHREHNAPTGCQTCHF